MTHADVGEHREFGFARDRARRIERVVEHQHAGARGDCSDELVSIVAPVGRAQRDRNRYAPGAAHHRRIAVVGGLEQDHLVPRRDEGEDGGGERFGRARRHDHLLARQGEALPPRIEGADRVAQFGEAERWRILVRLFGERARRGGDHVGGRRLVGEALAEVDRIMRPRKPRHMFEDRRRHRGVERVGPRHRESQSDRPGGGSPGGASAMWRTASARARSRMAAGTLAAWKT